MINRKANSHSSASSLKGPQRRGTSSAFSTAACRAASALGAAALLLLGVHPAQAANDAWALSPGSNLFNGINWTTGATIPGAATGTIAAGDVLYFGTSSITALTNNETAGFSIGGFNFNPGAAAFTIGGNAFALNGGITNSSTNLQTINAPFSMAATQTFTTTTGGGNLTFGGVISGAGGLTATGTGTTTLSNGNNSFTGNVTITGGTVTATNSVNDNTNTDLGSDAAAGRTITVGTGAANSGTLILTPNNVFGGGQQTNTNIPTLVINNGGLVIARNYDGLGPITLNGGTLTQNSTQGSAPANSPYQGYQFIGNITVGGTSASTISNNYNGVITNAGDSLGNDTTFNVGVTGAVGGDLIVSAPLVNKSGDYGAGDSALIKNGNGTMVLSGNNTYTGATTVNAGTLQVGAGGTTGSLASSSAITLAGGALTFNRSDVVTQATGISGAGSLTQAGTGTLVLSGADTYTGGTNVNSGTLNLTGSVTGNVAVASGATLAGSGDGATTGLIGGTVTAAGGSKITLATPGTQLASTGAVVLGNSGTYNPANYATEMFTLAPANTDEMLNTPAALTANNVFVTVTNPSQTGTFTLDNYASLTAGSDFSLSSTAGNVLTQNVGRDTETLTVNPTNLMLTVTGVTVPNVAYFNGAVSNVWNDTTTSATKVNFSLDKAGTVDAGNTPGANTDVILNADNATTNRGTTNLTETLGANTIINSLNVNGNGTTTLAADGHTLTINALGDSNTDTGGGYTGNPAGTGINIGSTANPFTVSVPLILGGSQSFTNASNSLFTVNGASITGTGTTSNPESLTLQNTGTGGTTLNTVIGDGAGGGTLALIVNNTGTGLTTLNGASTYTGGTTVIGGTLQLGDGTANNGSVVGNITDNTALIFANPNAQTYNGVISGAGTLAKSGAGTLTLANYNTFLGGTTVNAGTLLLTKGGGSGTVQGVVTVNPGATLTLGVNNALGYNNDGTEVTTLNVNGGTVNVNGNYGDEGYRTSFNLTGGTLAYASTNQASNAYQFAAGDPLAPGITSNASSTTSVVSGGVSIRSGNLQYTVASGTTPSGIDLLDSGLIEGGGFGITLNGPGVLALTGPNTYSGGTTVNSGTLEGTTAGLQGAITDNSALVFDQTLSSPAIASGTYGGVISGTGTVAKNNAGSVILSGANTYTGATAVNGGSLYVNGSLPSTSTVSVASGARLGGTGSVGATTVASGGSVEGGQFNTGTLTTNGLTFSGPGTAYFGNLANYTGTPAISAGTLTASGGANSVSLNVAGSIPGTGTYELLGYSGGSILGTGNSAFHLGTLPNRATGNLDFSHAGLIDLNVTGSDFLIFTGAASVANGWDTVTPNFKLNSNGAPTTDIDNPGDTVVFNDTAVTGTVNINSADVHPTAVTFNNNTLNYTVQGSKAIAGATGLTKTGTGTLTLTNTNTYTGLTALNGGILNVGSAGAIGTASPISFGGGTLQYSAANQTDYSNRFSAAANQAYSVDTNGQSVTFASALNSAGGSLAKTGAGTLTLGTFSTYSGGTTVNGGTLTLTTSSGTGNVQGAITVNPGATLSLATQDDLGYNVGSQVTQLNINGGTVDIAAAGGNEGYSTNVNLTGGTLSASGGGLFRFNNATPGSFGVTSNASATTSTISTNVDAFNGPLDYNVASGTTPSGIDLVDSGVIQSNSITKDGAGVLALTGANTYTGPTTINAGTLQLGDGTSGNDGTIAASPSIVDNSALVYDRFGTTNSYGGVISGTGTVTKTGVGTQTLTGANTYTGATTITGGNLTVGNGTTGSIASTSAVNVGGGTTLTVNDNGALNNTTTNVTLGSGGVGGTLQNGLNGTVNAPDGNGNVTTTNVQQAGTLALGTGTSDILDFANNAGTFDFAGADASFSPGQKLTIENFGVAANEMLGANPVGTEVGSYQLLFDTGLTTTQLGDISFLNSNSSQFGATQELLTSGPNMGKFQVLESAVAAPEPAQTAALGLFGLGLGALVLKARKRKADGAAL